MSESARVEVLPPTFEWSKLAVFSSRALCTGNWTRQLSGDSSHSGRVKDNRKGLKIGVLLVGRDSKTGALVRYHARPPDWSPSEGPEEFTHWVNHWSKGHGRISYSHGYRVASYKGFARRWTVSYKDVCTAPEYWHVSDKLQGRYANWTGCVSLRCGSSAAMSTSTSCGTGRGRKLCVSWRRGLWRRQIRRVQALPLIVLARLK